MKHSDLVQMLYDLYAAGHLLTVPDVLRATEKPWQYEGLWALVRERRDSDGELAA